MHIEFLVEEPSAEAALRCLVPKICGSGISFDIHSYRSKTDLLGKLPRRLKSYRNFMPPDWRIVVLVDEDRMDCLSLKNELEMAAQDAGLVTKSMAQEGAQFLSTLSSPGGLRAIKDSLNQPQCRALRAPRAPANS